jgi:hypothetical protein
MLQVDMITSSMYERDKKYGQTEQEFFCKKLTDHLNYLEQQGCSIISVGFSDKTYTNSSFAGLITYRESED